MKKTNVINFPNTNNILTKVDVDKALEDVKLYHIDESLEFLYENLIDHITTLGFPIQNSTDEISVFLYETMKAYLCNLYGIHHQMNDLVSKITRQDEHLGKVLDFSLIKLIKTKK